MVETLPGLRFVVQPELPRIEYQAALLFLDGHYLFLNRTGTGQTSKFVTASDVAAAFTGSEQDSGWLPAGVVRAGNGPKGKWFVYSTPPQKAEITFEGEEQPITIPLPRLVLLGTGAEYHIWALETKHFDSQAKAYHAPFPNVYTSGKICWGANTPGKADPAKARKSWNLFFSTPFNAHLDGERSKAHPKDVREQLREVAGKREYPVADLVPCVSSIGYYVEAVLGVH
jgi:hypothetical protein